jgi:hypothetical protein
MGSRLLCLEVYLGGNSHHVDLLNLKIKEIDFGIDFI